MRFGPFSPNTPRPVRPMSDIIADETPAWYYRAQGFMPRQPEPDVPMDFGFPGGGSGILPGPWRHGPMPGGWMSLVDGESGGATPSGGNGGSAADNRPVFGPAPDSGPAGAPRESTPARGVPRVDWKTPGSIRHPNPGTNIPPDIRAPQPADTGYGQGTFNRSPWFDLATHAPSHSSRQATRQASHWWYPLTPQGRAERNVNLPQSPKLAREKGGTQLPNYMAVYHDNGIGRPEQKFIFPDGREAVYDGDTGQLITDPRHAGTYNIVNPGVPSWNPLTWPETVVRGVGHTVADVIPYYIWGTGQP